MCLIIIIIVLTWIANQYTFCVSIRAAPLPNYPLIPILRNIHRYPDISTDTDTETYSPIPITRVFTDTQTYPPIPIPRATHRYR